MDTSKSFQHKNYDLLCGARALDRGRFAPTLCVSSHNWPARPRQIALSPGNFPSADAAIDAAYR
ncbi:MAG: hypothetical protein ABI809_12070, partial [Caldimonas sp.]